MPKLKEITIRNSDREVLETFRIEDVGYKDNAREILYLLQIAGRLQWDNADVRREYAHLISSCNEPYDNFIYQKVLEFCDKNILTGLNVSIEDLTILPKHDRFYVCHNCGWLIPSTEWEKKQGLERVFTAPCPICKGDIVCAT